MAEKQPNVLYVMTDQQRFDTIAALGNEQIYTPNFDRLARRGVAFTKAYTCCPVCVPARYNIRTGCGCAMTGVFENGPQYLVSGQAEDMEKRCGPFLARRMRRLGYRTFGVGKFHAHHDDLGYETYLLAGENSNPAINAHAAWLEREHPEFGFIEQYHGERTEMYYMPQMSPLPAECCQEAWAADRTAELIRAQDDRPFFGFCSFIGPHPPLAPPIPFNRMYDPDRMPNPVRGDLAVDHMDEQITWMNYAIWADDISDARARSVRARYWGEVSYIDQCLGRILDAVDALDDADNTLICFFADHGDHMGDHHAWQKESFFESACHIPFLLSWPARIGPRQSCGELVGIEDLFGIATTAAGKQELREGIDVLGMLDGAAPSRDYYFGIYGVPGSPLFKVMVRGQDWKYIYMANGGREQLFNLTEDPDELHQRIDDCSDVAERMRRAAVDALARINTDRALADGKLKRLPHSVRPPRRIYQMAGGVPGFPERPEDVLG